MAADVCLLSLVTACDYVVELFFQVSEADLSAFLLTGQLLQVSFSLLHALGSRLLIKLFRASRLS